MPLLLDNDTRSSRYHAVALPLYSGNSNGIPNNVTVNLQLLVIVKFSEFNNGKLEIPLFGIPSRCLSITVKWLCGNDST